ncbi:GHKL domain-containing protein [Streptococcus dentiloxodontae]
MIEDFWGFFWAIMISVLRSVVILLISRSISNILTSWKASLFVILGGISLSFLLGGIGANLAVLLIWYVLNRRSITQQNPFIFTILPWIFVEVINKILQVYLLPIFLQLSYDQVRSSYFLVVLSLVAVYPIFVIIKNTFLLDFEALKQVERNKNYRTQNIILTALTAFYLILSVIILYMSLYIDNQHRTDLVPIPANIGGVLSILYGLLFLYFFSSLNNYSKQQAKDKLALEMHRHEESLEEYSCKLEQLYREISQVKRDYQIGLREMEDSIAVHDIAGVKAHYADLLEKSGANLSLTNYELSRLINLEISPLKSLFSAKILEAESLGIQVKLELPDVISDTQMEILDLVVVSSIFLDNAIEAAELSEQPSLSIAFFKEDNNLILVITNTTQEENIAISKVFQEGYSSKGEGRGLGLAKVDTILSKYPNIHLETRSKNHYFTQLLVQQA